MNHSILTSTLIALLTILYTPTASCQFVPLLVKNGTNLLLVVCTDQGKELPAQKSILNDFLKENITDTTIAFDAFVDENSRFETGLFNDYHLHWYLYNRRIHVKGLPEPIPAGIDNIVRNTQTITGSETFLRPMLDEKSPLIRLSSKRSSGSFLNHLCDQIITLMLQSVFAAPGYSSQNALNFLTSNARVIFTNYPINDVEKTLATPSILPYDNSLLLSTQQTKYSPLKQRKTHARDTLLTVNSIKSDHYEGAVLKRMDPAAPDVTPAQRKLILFAQGLIDALPHAHA